jgi:hypothetical protein
MEGVKASSNPDLEGQICLSRPYRLINFTQVHALTSIACSDIFKIILAVILPVCLPNQT